MPESITVRVDGHEVTVPMGSTVAVAVAMSAGACRTSVSGEPRTPFCGMGTCFECRVQIDGELHRRGCQVLCKPKMEIRCRG
jgi:predicted molibdopterin-dependent oxidoreductase YjgC